LAAKPTLREMARVRVAFPRGTAKTAADCFKFGNNIGLDVTMEALREA
jgi:hypothetical protein